MPTPKDHSWQPDERWLRDMHDDLRSLNAKVQQIQVEIAAFNKGRIEIQLDKLDTKTKEHDDVLNQYKGAFRVIYFMLGVIFTVLTGVITWYLTR